MIRQDRAFELGAPRSAAPHPQILWVVASLAATLLFACSLWVYMLYPSSAVFHSLVLGGVRSGGFDVWRPLTSALFEPNVAGWVAALAAYFLIVKDLEIRRGQRWLLGLWLFTQVIVVLGFYVGDVWLAGRKEAVSFGSAAFLVTASLAYARDHADEEVYPFLFLQMKGRNLGLFVAICVMAAFDFRTMPFWSLRESHTVVAVIGPVCGILAGAAVVALEPIALRKIAMVRAMREISHVQAEAARRERIDSLLAKVSEFGLTSLSRRERRYLEEVARGLRFIERDVDRILGARGDSGSAAGSKEGDA